MTRAIVIFNPAARGEKSQRLRQFLESKTSAAISLAPTACAGDAQHIARRAVAEGCRLIIAAGGDGTINEVVNGIGTAGVPLAVLPLGTVNVFARELGLPKNLAAAWAVIERNNVRTIDLGRAESGGTLRYFVQLAGVGFDALAVRRTTWEMKKKVGELSYVWAGLQTLAAPLPQVEVRVDATGQWERGVAVLIGNGRLYGGAFAIHPRALLNDARLDVCVFEKGGVLDVLRYGLGILSGAHTKMRDVKCFQAEQFTCTAHSPVPFELDGELAGETNVKFSVVPHALRVVVP